MVTFYRLCVKTLTMHKWSLNPGKPQIIFILHLYVEIKVSDDIACCRSNTEFIFVVAVFSYALYKYVIRHKHIPNCGFCYMQGIIFFNQEDGGPCYDQSNYIWSDADWPHNGWANSESTPVPTRVSLGVGLGDKKGAHLGLGGATVGDFSLSKPGKSHRVPAYTGLGVSGLGWETHEDFEQLIDPPPIVETVIASAFSSHPTMPLFLVGSSNTHIYLWEV